MADNDVMIALGDGPDAYTFSMGTAAYNTMRRATSWRWAAVPRAGRRPARQFVGKGDDQITLDGVIYPHFKGGLNQLPRMREEADKGQPLQMVDSLGRVDYGYWCIVSIEETQTEFMKGGLPRKIAFTMTLEAYGEDTYRR